MVYIAICSLIFVRVVLEMNFYHEAVDSIFYHCLIELGAVGMCSNLLQKSP